MIISPSNNEYILAKGLHVNEIELSQVHVYEYLGILIDDKLTMGAHTDKVCKNVQKKYGILRTIRIYIS